MILKASQRSGGSQLAAHLLNDRDNDHVRVVELRGFASDDLHDAFQEAHAVARGTKCQQYLFSVSFNPPVGAKPGEADFTRAADEAETRLGLSGQPRVIVIHEKEGRRHAHVVWSRIDADAMRAINLPFFKRKLTDLSRDLFLDHDWALPEGLRTNGGKSPLNFTLEEWQQAKRHGRDPRESKDAIRDAWARSDSLAALKPALEERGYFLAQGDRRGFVVVDTDGEVFALARAAGIKTKEVRDRLGEPDGLPSVAAVKADLTARTRDQLKSFIAQFRTRQARDLVAVKAPLATQTETHRATRVRLDQDQAARWALESQARAARLRGGLTGLWDRVTGKRRETLVRNEAEAIEGLARDRSERDALVTTQARERLPLQAKLDALRQRQRQDRAVMARDVAASLARAKRAERPPDHDHPAPVRRRRGLSLDL